MSEQGNNSFNSHKIGVNTTEHIKGLELFRKGLEKNFYADVNIYNYSSKREDTNLSIEFNCNFSLSEALYYLTNPIPNGIRSNGREKTGLFLKAYSELKKVNNIPLDISELTIALTDTTILISKIYQQSISDQLENIAMALLRHNIYYTKGLTETPFELFIPVFEEDTIEYNTKLENIVTNNNSNQDYFIFWGVYYDCTGEAAIYDLNSRRIIRGDIQMLSE